MAGTRDERGGSWSPNHVLTTLQRGLRLLEAVAEHNGEVTARDLGRITGLKLGTCYHLLRTLEVEGYVVRLPGGHFAIGSRVSALQVSLRSALSPLPEISDILAALYEQVRETTYVSGWHGEDIVLQRYFEGSHAVRVRSLEIGYRDNAHARASCKAVFSFLPPDRIRSYFATRRLHRLTSRTVTDLETLMEQLRAAARQGYAVDREEFSEEVFCVAAAFFDAKGFPVGSYAVSGPISRLESRLKELSHAIVQAATRASRALGYAGPYPPRSPLVLTP